jgi:hypothetical protein
MGNYQDIYVKKVFSAETVAASGSANSDLIDLGGLSTTGHFSIQVNLTGDGTATFEYLLSNDGVNYITPSGSLEITTGHTKTSGPGTDGIDLYSFGPVLARYMKIKVSETGTSDTITVNAFLAIS